MGLRVAIACVEAFVPVSLPVVGPLSLLLVCLLREIRPARGIEATLSCVVFGDIERNTSHSTSCRLTEVVRPGSHRGLGQRSLGRRGVVVSFASPLLSIAAPLWCW